MKSRYDVVFNQLQEGGDQAYLGKELSSLSGLSSLCDKVKDIHVERNSLLELLSETESSNEEYSRELEEEIHEELSHLEQQLAPIAQQFMNMLVPLLDSNHLEDLTMSDAVIDIRAGTGGDEARLFAAELMAGYQAIAKTFGQDETGSGGKNWDLEVLSVSRTDLGGVKEASLVVSSKGGGYSYGNYFPDDSEVGDTEERLLKQLGPFGFFSYESG